MGNRSKISMMPPEVRGWLERTLIENGHRDFVLLADLCKDKGFAISKTAIGLFSKKLERRTSGQKAMIEAAIAFNHAAPDDEAALSSAALGMIQSGILEAITDMTEAEETPDAAERVKLLSRAGKALGEVSRAHVNVKKYAMEIRAKVTAAADAAAKLTKKGGMSAAGTDQIRKMILGIAN